MKGVLVFVLVAFSLLYRVSAAPYYPYYGSNFDTLAYGSNDNRQGAVVLSRFYQPLGSRSGTSGSGFVYQPNPQGYYQSERKQSTAELPAPQQNEVFQPQVPEEPITARIEPEITEKVDFTTTLRPELSDEEMDEVPVQKTKKIASRKRVRKPLDEEADEEYPQMPAGGMMFPMFFGYGRSAGGEPGLTAVANAFSTGRGGVATSHATAYGPPKPEEIRRRY